MNVGDFFVALGLKVDSKDHATLNKFVQSLGNLDLASIAAVAGLGALAYSFEKVYSSAMEAALGVHGFEVQTGLSGKQMQMWANLAEQLGASASDATNTIKNLALASEQIKLGQGNIAPYQMLGIDPRQDPFKIIDQLHERVKKLNPSMARLILSQMGVSEGMLNVINAADEEYYAMRQQVFITEKHVESLRELNKEWVIIKQAVVAFAHNLMGDLAPALQHSLHYIKSAVKGMNNLIDMIGKPTAFAIGAVLVTALNPFVTLIGLAILALDDLYRAIHGGKSVIGGFLDYIEPRLVGMIERVIELKDLLMEAYDGLVMMYKMPSMHPLVAGASAQQTGQTITNNITVQSVAAEGPLAVGEAVADAIKRHLSDATYQAPKANK